MSGAFAAFSSAPPPTPLLTSLVEYWPLDEASGDAIGAHAGLTLADNATVTSQVTGGPDGGRCRQFTSANNEYLSRASEAALQLGDSDFTIAVWAYLDTNTQERALVSKWGNAGIHREWLLQRSELGNRFDFAISSDGSTVVRGGATTFGALSTGRCYFVVVKHDATGDTIKIRVNDGVDDSAAHSGGAFASTEALCLGEIANPLGVIQMNGREAYAAIWRRVLTDAQLTWLYNSGAGRTYAAVAAYHG